MLQHTNEHDENTPTCHICGNHMGILEEGVLMLSGAYVFNQEFGCVEFMLAPDTQIQFLEHPDLMGPGKAQLGCVAHTAHPTAVVHNECVAGAVEYALESREEDEEEYDMEEL